MSTVDQELQSFNSYALARIQAGRNDLRIDELFDEWRAENPSDELYAENVAAVQASIRDYKDGECGTVAGEDSMQLRREFGEGR